MRFLNPEWLWGLAIVPVVAALWWMSVRRQRRRLTDFAGDAMAGRLAPSVRAVRRVARVAASLVALSLAILAAARPAIGERQEMVHQRGVDVFILLDVSRSMLTEDVTPSRLERAKSDILDLLARLSGDRAGLIPFAGHATLSVPLTTDLDYLRIVLADVGPDTIPRGGSWIGDAIKKALAALPRNSNREQVLVLITDGEDQQSDSLAAAREAAKRGIRIFTVGLGDPVHGGKIPIKEHGDIRYLEYDGREVISRMDEQLLETIARETGAAYIPARNRDYDLGQIYLEHLAHLRQGELEGRSRRVPIDRYQWFLGAAGALWCLESLLTGGSRAAREALT